MVLDRGDGHDPPGPFDPLDVDLGDPDVADLARVPTLLDRAEALLELDVGIAIRGPLLRAQAAVLPAGLIDPHQLLYWNRQAPLVCFAENRAGEVFVSGEIPLESLSAETLDRFLGLLLASATRAREVAIQNAGRQ